ncbi:MAG: hypothetical protein ABFC31_08115 [Clostridiaceae bacterium]
MSEQGRQPHQVIHPPEENERKNATLIWRKRSAPVGSAPRGSDRAFIRRALSGSLIVVLVLTLIGYLAYRNISSIKQAYAGILISRGEYEQAERWIEKLDDETVKDELLRQNYYAYALRLDDAGKLTEAAALYLAAGDYADAVSRWQDATYRLAALYEADGDYLEAGEAFDSLGDYLDAPDRGDACDYAYALERLEYGYYDEAMRLFYALGDYEQSEEYAMQSAAALSENEGAGDLVSLLVGLTDEQLAARAELKTERDTLPKGILATGYLHTVARTEQGTVLATGSNLSGQCNVTDWSNVVSVAAGAYHTAALLGDGTVVACGSNQYGQCDVSKWQNVVSLYAGAYNTVGVTSDGTILNTGFEVYQTIKWHNLSSLSVGDYALCGVMLNGSALTTSASLVTDDYYDLVALDAASANSIGLKADGALVSNGLDVSGLSDILAIDCTENGLFALTHDGKVEARFYNASDAIDVSGWSNIVAISASSTHVVGVTAEGRVLSAGWNAKGQCEVGDWVLFTPEPTPSPEPVQTPEP